MIRRLLVYTLVAVVLYYGYHLMLRASSVAPDIRSDAAAADNRDPDTNTGSDPLGEAVRRRRAEEESVRKASGN